MTGGGNLVWVGVFVFGPALWSGRLKGISLKRTIDLLKDPEVRGATLEAFGAALEIVTSIISSSDRSQQRELIDCVVPYGPQKKNGGHNHKYNKGGDRTPAQKAADIGRKKP